MTDKQLLYAVSILLLAGSIAVIIVGIKRKTSDIAEVKTNGIYMIATGVVFGLLAIAMAIFNFYKMPSSVMRQLYGGNSDLPYDEWVKFIYSKSS